MNEHESIRMVLAGLREDAGLTQAQLAERLSFTPSRLSRLESGDTELSRDEAEQIASKIGTGDAKSFARYLGREWHITPRPGFKHVSLEHLWRAEMALQRLRALENDPDLKNAFLQQIRSCRAAIERAAANLLSTEHPVALMGPPEVGKTTIICTLAGLRQMDVSQGLDEQMALQTGGGRVTICEVHVRNGSEYSITVDACSVEEVHQFVSEFCDDLLRNLENVGDQASESWGISSEVDRAIRNMAGLNIKRTTQTDGQKRREDLAHELAKAFPKKEDLLVQVLTRMDLPRRTKTSVTFPREATISGLDWLADMFAKVNYGRHPEFSLPRRIEITVPTRILGAEELDVRLIDTRGVDEPAAPRRDLQAYLDDGRCIVALCSKFGDAPTAATLSVIERAIEGGGRQTIVNRGLLLVLPREQEDVNVRDSNTGQWVSGAQEGRDVKLEHIATTLLHRGCQELPVQFVNVRNAQDCADLRETLIGRICELRKRQEAEIDLLVATIDGLITNRKTEEARAVFRAAIKPLRVWFANNGRLPESTDDKHGALLREMNNLRYVSSLRASVNRRGNWYNFDYWYGLGFGTRSETVTRTDEPVRELRALVKNALANEDLAAVHNFVRLFSSEIEKAMADFYQWAQTLGESAFKAQLVDDNEYWSDCQERWGGGSGYRNDIMQWTEDWFSDERRQERRDFIDGELQRRWGEILVKLNLALSSEPEPIKEGLQPDERISDHGGNK